MNQRFAAVSPSSLDDSLWGTWRRLPFGVKVSLSGLLLMSLMGCLGLAAFVVWAVYFNLYGPFYSDQVMNIVQRRCAAVSDNNWYSTAWNAEGFTAERMCVTSLPRALTLRSASAWPCTLGGVAFICIDDPYEQNAVQLFDPRYGFNAPVYTIPAADHDHALGLKYITMPSL